MGIAPTILWGRERRQFTRRGVTHCDPDWLAYDYALLTALDIWEASLCIVCHKPEAEHKGKTREDYAAAFVTCPSYAELDAQMTAQAKSDGHEDAKPDPTRARGWFVMPADDMRAMKQANDD